jgi:hypothetical protein
MQLPAGRSKQWTWIFNYESTRRPPSIWPRGNNLSSYAHGQLRLEQAKLDIAYGVVSRNGWKSNVLLISTGLARAMQAGPVDRRVDGLCNRVCFTDVAAPSGCWRLSEEKTRGWERHVAPFRKKRAKTGLLYLKSNYLSFALGFESIGSLVSALWAKIGSKVVSDMYWKG